MFVENCLNKEDAISITAKVFTDYFQSFKLFLNIIKGRDIYLIMASARL